MSIYFFVSLSLVLMVSGLRAGKIEEWQGWLLVAINLSLIIVAENWQKRRR